jgi:hypothetical protein
MHGEVAKGCSVSATSGRSDLPVAVMQAPLSNDIDFFVVGIGMHSDVQIRVACEDQAVVEVLSIEVP